MPATHNGWLLLAINGPLAGLIGYVAMHVSFLSGVTCLLALAIGHYLARTVLFGGDHYIDLSGPIVSFIAQKLQGQGETPTSDAPQLTRKRTTASSANSNGRPSTKVPPWQNLKIAEPVNAAIEEFIELTLKTYVNSWYDSEISEDRAFLQEIRYQIRYLGAGVVRKLEAIDLSTLILDHAVPVAVTHAEVYGRIKEHFGQNASAETVEQRVLDFIRTTCLHRAMYTRTTELMYLRRVAELLMSRLIDQDRVAGWPADGHERSASAPWASHVARHFLRELVVFAFLLPALDIIADPEIINDLLILLFDPEPIVVHPHTPLPQVPFLEKLTQMAASSAPDSLLQVKLADIVLPQNTNLRYQFIQYLTDTRGPVNLLNFFMSVSDIQTIMRTPLASEQKQFEETHFAVWELYQRYVHASGADRIEQLPDDLVDEFRIALETKSDQQLLEKAVERSYRLAYHWLQYDHLIPFCQSESFMGNLCGSPPVADEELCDGGLPDQKVRRRHYNAHADSGFTFAKFRNRFVSVFVPSVTEGSLDVNQSQSQSQSPALIPRQQFSSVEWAADVVGSTILQTAPSILVTDDDNPDIASDSGVSTMEREMSESDLRSFDEERQSSSSPMDADDLDSQGGSIDSIDPMEPRDMTKWRVKIPKVEPRKDRDGKTVYVFIVTVDRLGANDSRPQRFSMVDRRYNEFFTLEAKLIEFHGSHIIMQPLPPKKTFVNKGRAFSEMLRPNFEKFLQRLCAQPELKGSEMLFAFLTSKDEIRDNFLPDLNPWRAVKRMPAKFSRERGQNLKFYLNGLFASVLSGVDTNGSERGGGGSMTKSKSTDIRSEAGSSISSWSIDKMLVKEKLINTPFRNNCGLDPDDPSLSSELHEKTASYRRHFSPITTSTYDALLFVSLKIFHVARWLFMVLVSARILLRDTVDSTVRILLRRVLKVALHDLNIVRIVELLRDAIFYRETTQTTEQQRRARADLARRMTVDFLTTELPAPAIAVVGRDRFVNGVELLFECLQNPRLNKQLTYVLLDLLVQELFPDVKHS